MKKLAGSQFFVVELDKFLETFATAVPEHDILSFHV